MTVSHFTPPDDANGHARVAGEIAMAATAAKEASNCVTRTLGTLERIAEDLSEEAEDLARVLAYSAALLQRLKAALEAHHKAKPDESQPTPGKPKGGAPAPLRRPL